MLKCVNQRLWGAVRFVRLASSLIKGLLAGQVGEEGLRNGLLRRWVGR